MTDNSIADPFGLIADEFVHEFRSGRRPSVEEFARRYPEHADEIREILPTLALMEEAKSPADASSTRFPPAHDTASLIGRELGDFRIIREIGRGGMGIVYEAEQVPLGRRVAVKVLPRQALADSRQRRRFDREAKAAARLHHTNIVPVFGVGEQDGLCYYAMQYIRGLGLDLVLDELRRIEQLAAGSGSGHGSRAAPRASRDLNTSVIQFARDLLSGRHEPSKCRAESVRGTSPTPENAQPWPASSGEMAGSVAPAEESVASTVPQDSISGTASRGEFQASQARNHEFWHSVARLGVQAADALQYAHDHGITHRDIKPSNLLLDLQGTVWVTDFGLAKSNDQQDLTQSGDILGTIRYLPPEAFDGRVDPRGDVYSLGLTLYELVTLQPAFDETDYRKLVKRVTTGETPRIERVSPEVPRDLAIIIQKAIERDPVDRYASAQEFADDLQRFMRDEPVLARRASLPEQARRWARRNKGLAAAMAGIASLLLIIALGATGAAMYYRHQEERQRQLLEQTVILSRNNKQLAEANRQALVAALDASQKLEIARVRAEDQEERTRQHLYFAQMSVAQKAWLGHRGLLRTEMLLDAWRPQSGQKDLRGWEWYFILGLCRREQVAFSGHSATVTCVAFSPDGTRLASASHDGVVCVWNPHTGICEARLTKHRGRVYSLCWNATGTLLASAGDEGVILWDGASHEQQRTIPCDHPVYSVAFSPDDRTLARGVRPGPLELFDTRTWEKTGSLWPHAADVYTETISFSPDGRRLAAPAWRDVIVWDVASQQQQFVLKGHSGSCQAATFSPDGTRLATTSRDAIIKVWDVKTGTLLTNLTGHTHAIASLAWHPSGERLASAAWDGTSRLWDLTSGREFGVLGGHARHVFSVAWHPQGDQLVTGGDDRLIKLWEPTVAKEAVELIHADAPVVSMRWSADGEIMFTGSEMGRVEMWNARTGKLLGEYKTPPGPVRCVAIHPHTAQVAAACNDGSIIVWNGNTGEQQFTLREHTSFAVSVHWDPSGARLVTAGRDGSVVLWDAETRTQLRTLLGHSPSPVRAKFSPDGNRLASAGDDGTLRIWDLESGQAQVVDAHQALISDVAFSLDGSQIATSSDDHTVRLWDAATGRQHRVLEGHSEAIATVAFSPDGHRLLSADRRGTIKLWDVVTGMETLALRGPVGQLHTAAFSPDGMQILANSDHRVLLWDARHGYTRAASHATD